jgi:tetratricopeptide (TPR) repeat protein
MHNYADALPDLNKAISLNSNYINALMNRGDIHNYYYAIDRKAAIADYEKVISLGGTKGTSVCGHLYLAQHNGWNLGTVLGLPSAYFSCR